MTVGKYQIKSGTRWRVRYKRPDGTRTDRRGFASKRAAQLWEAENLVAMATGAYVSKDARELPLSELLSDTLRSGSHLAPSSLASRESTARTWVAPYWDDRLLGSVTPAAVEEWLDWMRGQAAGESTVEKAYRCFQAMMRLAVGRRLIPSDPTPTLRKKRVQVPERAYLTHEQLSQLAAQVDLRYRTLIGVLGYCGLRVGEAAALKVKHVDEVHRRLRVRRAVVEVRGEVLEGPTKSAGVRDVAYPAFLAPHIRRQIAGRGPEEYVFRDPEGGVLRPSSFRSRFFNPAVDALVASHDSFPRVTPHGLRHTAASLSIQAGASVKSLQKMLGHASAKMTLDVYSHVYDTDLDLVAEQLDEVVGKTGGWVVG